MESPTYPLLITEKEARNLMFVLNHYLAHHNPYPLAQERLAEMEVDLKELKESKNILDTLKAIALRDVIEKVRADFDNKKEPDTLRLYRDLVTKLYILKAENELSYEHDELEKKFYGNQEY